MQILSRSWNHRPPFYRFSIVAIAKNCLYTYFFFIFFTCLHNSAVFTFICFVALVLSCYVFHCKYTESNGKKNIVKSWPVMLILILHMT